MAGAAPPSVRRPDGLAPEEARSPRFFRQTTPTAWSIESSFVRLPAPRWSAARPTLIAPSRRTKEDSIDHAVGVVCHAKRGAGVGEGDVLAEVHTRDDESGAEAVAAVLAAYELGDEPPPERGILLDVVA